jgi:hypothetical protein
MDLEVKVVGGPRRIPGVADEPDHVAGLDLGAILGERRVGREVRVVVLVSLSVAKPEPVAAKTVPADLEERPVGHCQDGCAQPGENVVAVMPARIGSRGVEIVGERRGAVDREHVALTGDLGLDVRGRVEHDRRRPRVSPAGLRRRGLRGDVRCAVLGSSAGASTRAAAARAVAPTGAVVAASGPAPPAAARLRRARGRRRRLGRACSSLGVADLDLRARR